MTLEDFDRALERVFRKAPHPPQPRHTIDFDLIAKHQIRCGYDPLAEMWLFSSAEMRRAREVGAVKNIEPAP